jgi:hypothetical protein
VLGAREPTQQHSTCVRAERERDGENRLGGVQLATVARALLTGGRWQASVALSMSPSTSHPAGSTGWGLVYFSQPVRPARMCCSMLLSPRAHRHPPHTALWSQGGHPRPAADV